MDRFLYELADTNRRRMRVMMPIMGVVHLVHVVAFWPAAAERATLEPALLDWREGLVAVHLATATVAFAWAAFAVAASPRRWFGPAVGATWLLHGAAIAAVDQLAVPTVTPYVGYSIVIAVLLCLEPLPAVAAYAVGLVAFVAALVTMQPDETVRQALMPNGFTITVGALCLSTFLHASRRRDFDQRETIATQQRELEGLNADLEQRVQDQVAEIVRRAEEVERLNAHLRAQVQARSTELSQALAALSARAPTAPEPKPGDVLAGRFEVVKRIGAGAMGAVFRGTDRETGQPVAIKIVQTRSTGDSEAHQRFLREARVAAAVRHPAVIRMLHVDVTQDGVLYQVQELVEGETLADACKRVQRCDPAVVARIGAILADALAAVHALDVVHRDVKPANVMLTATEPGLKLLDFGISRPGAGDEDEVGTRTDVIVGTPAFMAPEVLAGRDATDRVDVYAFGVTLFFALAGRYPFDDVSIVGMAHNHQRAAPHVSTVEPSAPQALGDVVAACLARDPADRPDAAALAARLAALADPRPLDALVREAALGRTAVIG